jgi:hypothetical protein
VPWFEAWKKRKEKKEQRTNLGVEFARDFLLPAQPTGQNEEGTGAEPRKN